MRFVHTADWQIGARFRQFGEKAPALRAVRLRTLGRALEYAAAAGSRWGRAPFSAPPAHVKIFRAAEAVPLGEGWLLANPLRQKSSTIDPSLALQELARGLPARAIKVGVTHGSPAIEGKYQPDDFPIAVNAASRAGLEYLALGHWHGHFALEGGRLVMPGTPEP